MGVKGQFFVISVIIMMISVSTVMIYLLFPFGLKTQTMYTATDSLIQAKNIVQTMSQANSILSSWSEPLLNNKAAITIYNNGSSDYSGLVGTLVNLGDATPEYGRLYNGNSYIPFSYDSVPLGYVLFFDSSVPSSGQKTFYFYYPNSTQQGKAPGSPSGIVYSNSTDTVTTRFYTAHINIQKNGIIDSLINDFSGMQMANTTSGLFGFDFAGRSSTDSNLSLIGLRTEASSDSVSVIFNLTDNFNINVQVSYEFFGKYVKARYTFKYITGSFQNVNLLVMPNCLRSWTLESDNGSVIKNYCQSSSSFNNANTGESLALYSPSDSLSFVTPKNYAWASGITFTNLDQNAMPFSSGISIGFSYDDLTSKSSAEIIAMIGPGQTNSSFSSDFKNGLEMQSSSSITQLSSKEQDFENALETNVLSNGAALNLIPSYHESLFENNNNQQNWFKQAWNITDVKVSESAGINRVNEIVDYTFNNSFTDYLVLDSSGNPVASTAVANGETKTVYFLANVSAKSFSDYSIYTANNSITPINDVSGSFISGDNSSLFFNNFFTSANISLKSSTISNLTIENNTIQGVANDFMIEIDGSPKSASRGDFALENYSSNSNNLFARLSESMILGSNHDVTANSTYTFYNNYIVLKRIFGINTSGNFIGNNNFFWGSNNTDFPVFNSTNMTDYYYDGSWNNVAYVNPNPSQVGGPSNGEYFAVLYWQGEGFYITVAAKTLSSTDLNNLYFGLASGAFTDNKQMPYWAQSGTFNTAGLEVALGFGFENSRGAALNDSELFYEKFANPLIVSKIDSYVGYTNLFDYSENFETNNSLSSMLSNVPLTVKADNVPGTISSLIVSSNNNIVDSQVLSGNLGMLNFTSNIKNFDAGTPVRYALFNPLNQSFNVSLGFSGTLGTYVNYSITDPYNQVISRGSYDSPKTFEVNNSKPGFYTLSLLSTGDYLGSSNFNMNSTLTQGCLLSKNWSFSGNQMFLFYAPPGVSTISFTLSSQSSQTPATWQYTIYDENMNYLSGNQFPQGSDIKVSYSFSPYVNGRFFWVSFSYVQESQQINWLGVNIDSGAIACVGSSLPSWIDYYSPSVNMLFYSDILSGQQSFSILDSSSGTLISRNSSDLSWNENSKSAGNSIYSMNYKNLSLSLEGSNNWLSSWVTGSYYNFSDPYILENGPLRNVVSASSGPYRYYFINYRGQDYFKVYVSNYSLSGSSLPISVNGFINGDNNDYWYKFYGYPETQVSGTQSVNYTQISCLNGYTYLGRKDSKSILAVIIPCNELSVSGPAMSVSPDSLYFSLSKIRSNYFYVKAFNGYQWSNVENFINSLNAVSTNSGSITYDYTYSSPAVSIS